MSAVIASEHAGFQRENAMGTRCTSEEHDVDCLAKVKVHRKQGMPTLNLDRLGPPKGVKSFLGPV